jgi:deoxyinosine 3'endonuclease (endonuclease V)
MINPEAEVEVVDLDQVVVAEADIAQVAEVVVGTDLAEVMVVAEDTTKAVAAVVVAMTEIDADIEKTYTTNNKKPGDYTPGFFIVPILKLKPY